MIQHDTKTHRSIKSKKIGSGLVDLIINKLHLELHFPNYTFCGLRTRLLERLNKGQVGFNPLDAACREQDVALT